jgi:Suppressor of forked protein (Suf)
MSGDDDDDDALFDGDDDAAEPPEPQQPAPSTPTPTTSSSKPSILLGGDDGMEEEEDEDVDMPLPPPPPPPPPPPTMTTMMMQQQQQQQQQYQQHSSDVGGGGTSVAAAHSKPRSRPSIISHIVTPSPYAHHNSGPTSSRFRNALNRITLHPTTDVEAWQAIMTEVSTCWRNLVATNSIHPATSSSSFSTNINMEMQAAEAARRLDWVESVYGNLLLHFPYAAVPFATSLCEIFLAQSARVGEDQGPAPPSVQQQQQHSAHAPPLPPPPPTPRAMACEQKLEGLLEHLLGFDMNGNPVTTTTSTLSSSLSTFDDAADSQKTTSTSGSSTPEAGGLCSWSVELWLLYIQKAQRDATRHVSGDPYSNSGMIITSQQQQQQLPPDQRSRLIREATVQAYELALQNAGFCHNNHLLWKSYLDYVRSWTNTSSSSSTDNDSTTHHLLVAPQQMIALRSIYQRLIVHPMVGLDKYWHEYEAFERQQSEALAQALLQEFGPKYQHARSVYLERNRVYNFVDLQLARSSMGGGSAGNAGTGASGQQQQRLATPPASDASLDYYKDANAGTNAAGGGTGAGAAGAAVGTGGTDGNQQQQQAEVAAKMDEEDRLLTLWKKRCSYERTNPERLPSRELAVRIRVAFKEMACVLTRHPECWHGWSMWELSRDGGGVSSSSSSANGLDERTSMAVSVLRQGQEHIPDCTLLAYAEAQVLELYYINNNSNSTNIGNKTSAVSEKSAAGAYDTFQACLAVMERFLDRSPTTLGYVLYQQMVRRYKGIKEARAVFGKARRVLVDQEEFQKLLTEKLSANNLGAAAGVGAAGEEGDADAVGVVGATAGGAAASATTTTTGTPTTTPASVAGAAAASTSKEAENGKQRWMVTNRLDPSIGTHRNSKDGGSNKAMSTGSSNEAPHAVNGDTNHHHQQQQQRPLEGQHQEAAGPITWHLYASHATIEHRLNHAPEVAARVYELGLRKHASFLTKPAYVMRYSQLLLELGDTMNLRALLTRAVATCEAQDRRDALASLWDMTLHFETIISGSDQNSMALLRKIEQRRREAILGPDVEDVATGGIVGMGETTLIGAQKSTIAEHLIRTEGYDLSSSIVNGMGRTVDVLEVMGLWGSRDYDGGGNSSGSRRRIRPSSATLRDDIAITSGSMSDASFHKRLEFQRMRATGMTYDSMMGDVTAASKLLSARERLQQGAGAGATAGPTTAIMLAIQQMPEWLRPLLILLPASRLRFPVVAKPPPHLTEIALTMLRQNPLPAERPENEAVSGTKRKLQDKGGDSSDDDDDAGIGGSGYGNTFRARQRARMMTENGQQANGAR